MPVSSASLTHPHHVVLKPRRAQPFFGRHPWVFAGAIAHVAPTVHSGGEVALYSDQGDFIAWGLYNPHSAIRVRLYSWNEAQPLDRGFFADRLREAIAIRRDRLRLIQSDGACRLVFSEADGLSGLTIDKYGDWLLVQFTSLALAQRQAMWLELLQEQLAPRGIWLRTEKGIREAEGLELRDGLIAGEAPPRPFLLTEHDLTYEVDLQEGQKTGFFLDQRDNRLAVARYAAGARVLDVCCYTGGFSLNALKHGNAASVLGVDSSERALALAQSNATRNGVADRFTTLKSDAFKALELLAEQQRQFDLIVLDPPKLARHNRGVDEALRGYHSLNVLAVNVLAPGGTLVSCSCSGSVTREMFERMLAEVAISTSRPLRLLETRGPAPDHAPSLFCPETHYLKCDILAVG